MHISDNIADFINKLLENADGVIELQRGTLADRFGCAPSQINYVISTRFSPEHGFIVESRRGGGGYIRISRVRLDRSSALMHIVNSIGDEIGAASARACLRNMADSGIISERDEGLISSAISQNALSGVPPSFRSRIRADIFKSCLVSLI